MNVSVVVPAYQEAASIGTLLDALRTHATTANAIGEILVYDDGSTDRTSDVVAAGARCDARVRLIRGAAREGRSAACNALLAGSRGDRIVKFDADVVPEAGAVDALCAAIDGGAAMSFGVCEPVSRRRTLVTRGASHAARIVQELQRGPRGADFAVGRIIALRGDVARSTSIPDGVTNDDHWLTLSVRARGEAVVLASKAACRFLVPETFDDYRRQSNRVREGERQLERMAGLAPMGFRDLVPAIARCAARDPVGAACWAAIYGASLLTTSRSGPADEAPITSSKGPVDESLARP